MRVLGGVQRSKNKCLSQQRAGRGPEMPVASGRDFPAHQLGTQPPCVLPEVVVGAESRSYPASLGDDKEEGRARPVAVGAVDSGMALHPGKGVPEAGQAGSKDWRVPQILIAWNPQNRDPCTSKPGNPCHGRFDTSPGLSGMEKKSERSLCQVPQLAVHARTTHPGAGPCQELELENRVGQQRATGAQTPGSSQHPMVSLLPHPLDKWRVHNTKGCGRQAWELPVVGLGMHELGHQRAEGHWTLVSFQSLPSEGGRAGSLSTGCQSGVGILPHQWGTRVGMGSRMPTAQILAWKYPLWGRRSMHPCNCRSPGCQQEGAGHVQALGLVPGGAACHISQAPEAPGAASLPLL